MQLKVISNKISFPSITTFHRHLLSHLLTWIEICALQKMQERLDEERQGAGRCGDQSWALLKLH